MSSWTTSVNYDGPNELVGSSRIDASGIPIVSSTFRSASALVNVLVHDSRWVVNDTLLQRADSIGRLLYVAHGVELRDRARSHFAHHSLAAFSSTSGAPSFGLQLC